MKRLNLRSEDYKIWTQVNMEVFDWIHYFLNIINSIKNSSIIIHPFKVILLLNLKIISNI